MSLHKRHIEFDAVVRDDKTVSVPLDFPNGEAHFVATPLEKSGSKETNWRALANKLNNLPPAEFTRRTKEEIDDYLENIRAERSDEDLRR